jgi:hypothetical protein
MVAGTAGTADAAQVEVTGTSTEGVETGSPACVEVKATRYSKASRAPLGRGSRAAQPSVVRAMGVRYQPVSPVRNCSSAAATSPAGTPRASTRG